MITAIVAAAGNSVRFKEDKIFLQIGTLTVLESALIPFLNNEEIVNIIVTVNSDNIEKANELLSKYTSIKPITIIKGGATRMQSIRRALDLVDNIYVLIHDGARPNLTADLLKRVIEKTKNSGSCAPIAPLKDSIRNEDGALPREWFSLVQTPQGFEAAKLKIAYQMANEAYTDDASVFESVFGIVSTVEGDPENIKITYPSDYYGLHGRDIVVGVGYDAHRLEKGHKLILGGVEIPFDKGLVSHSDGDCLTHAIMDAILTAINEGDIGKVFPDSEEIYKGISSLILLKKVLDIATNKGFFVKHISATIMAEAPKLATILPSISACIAKALNVDAASVAIAATTTEGLGIIGEQKGMAAHAVACLVRNKS